jgi:hypothetical protein
VLVRLVLVLGSKVVDDGVMVVVVLVLVDDTSPTVVVVAIEVVVGQCLSGLTFGSQ